MFSQLKLWGAAALAAVIAGLVVSAKVLKGQRDRARRARDTLRSTLGAKRKAEIARRKAEEMTRDAVEEIKKEVEKDDDEFKGIDNLSDSSDWGK